MLLMYTDEHKGSFGLPFHVLPPTEYLMVTRPECLCKQQQRAQYNKDNHLRMMFLNTNHAELLSLYCIKIKRAHCGKKGKKCSPSGGIARVWEACSLKTL
ncbi:hypothetical protein C5O19_24460 [Siphonobacter curvatus]|uniref:Uncharacterized protein n=1 Tax=Siphonobacter curvatus TaxID=2094562 RepID=A0A2S7IF03_9BACT|nr:hypothetical protein C5O19_24460 [Siphonobacter curvatus]